MKFGEIGAPTKVLKIWRDWSLPFGEIGVPRDEADSARDGLAD